MIRFGFSSLYFIIAIFAIATSAFSSTYMVDNLGDSDDGESYSAGDGTNTLRKCIRLANDHIGADTINFNISGTILPGSTLPELIDNETIIDASSRWSGVWPEGQPGINLDGSNAGSGASGLVIHGVEDCQIRGLFITKFSGNGIYIASDSGNNTIGGTNYGNRNVISGNGRRGVNINGSNTTNNIVSGNYIGTNTSGDDPLGNGRCGIGIEKGAKSNTIGGSSAGSRNVISSNGGNGIRIVDSGTNANTVLGNYIGTNSSGNGNLGNDEYGIYIHNGAQSNFINDNKIAFSKLDGVRVENINTDYNKILLNSIHDNANLGINLLDGGNDEINAPVITSAKLGDNDLTLVGTGAGGNATVEFFEADSFAGGEGKKYLGNLTADNAGNFSGTLNVSGKNLSNDDPVVATTTHNNNTSEFSTPVKVRPGGLCYTLKEGWNLISFSVSKCFYYGNAPTDQPGCIQLVNLQSQNYNSLAEWFDTVIYPKNSWVMVIGKEGAMARSLAPEFHSLKYMSSISGYWVKIAQGIGEAELCLDGTAFNPDCAISLAIGWNLVGYPLSNTGYYDTPDHPDIPDVNWVKVEPPVAAYVFKSINGKYSMIIGEKGAYNPELPTEFSSLHYIAPCQAFWVKMEIPGDLKYSLAGPP